MQRQKKGLGPQPLQRLMVSHSHSCGPAPAPPVGRTEPDWPLDKFVMLDPTNGRWDMLKPPTDPRLLVLVPAKLWLEVSDRAASLEPVESPGLSMSIAAAAAAIAAWSRPPAPLLWRRWRLEPVAAERDTEAAPGPGALLGGAAAMGTTPLPPTTPLVDPVLP